ncbi:MAG: elongation factor G [Spirochaetota bacterium]|nr:MAG: elongation factor G [Spirochaetota bacterium]
MEKINVALVGHTSVGKTQFLDTALYVMGVVDTIGKVDEGKSLSDFDEEEIKRKISIHSTVFNTEWDGKLLNMVDTPGSSDFIGEVASSFYGVDSVIMLIDSVNGVEIETRKIFSRAKNMELPIIIFINKMDKERADYKAVLENVKVNLNANIVPLQIPVGKESSFSGVVDLLRMKSYLTDESGKGAKEQDVPEELKSEAEEYRLALIEAAAESTDELTEKYLEGESLTYEEIEQGLKKRIADREVVPVLFGSSLMCKGIKEAIDFIIKVAPRSNFKEKIKALDIRDLSKEVEILKSIDSDFTGIVFKTLIDQFTGKITFLRVLSGVLKSEEDVYNRTKDRKERLSKPSRPFGKNQLPLKRDSEEGDIIVFTKLPYAETGDTLTALNKEVILPELSLPQPVHSVAIRAKNKKEEDKLSSLLGKAAEEDISFNVVFNGETKQTVISGMGELQIGIILSQIKEKNGIELETSTPLVAYRETISAPAKADYKHKKQTGGHGQYGQVFLEIEPLSRGEGFEFVDKIVGGVIPKGYIPGVEKGVKEAMEEGVVAGYPVVDVKVSLVFGSFHDVDSSELAFKIAGRQAFKLAMEQGKPTLLEPIMDLNVYVEEKYTGDIMSDLNGKRGKVLGMDNIGGGTQLIRAKVPQAELLKYSIELRSITSGTGSFEMDFSHYEPISGKIAEDVVKGIQSRKEALEKEK